MVVIAVKSKIQTFAWDRSPTCFKCYYFLVWIAKPIWVLNDIFFKKKNEIKTCIKSVSPNLLTYLIILLNLLTYFLRSIPNWAKNAIFSKLSNLIQKNTSFGEQKFSHRNFWFVCSKLKINEVEITTGWWDIHALPSQSKLGKSAG